MLKEPVVCNRKTKFMSSSVQKSEIGHFSKDAPHWWDENGPFAPLHRLNPARLSYIKAQICTHYGRDEKALKAFEGLSVLDIGCGGGLVCEPMARLGANVTGIDADAVAIEVAREHAAQSGLEIDYQSTSAEELLSLHSPRKRGPSEDPRFRGEDSGVFDVVLALEIIEHVANPQEFVRTCARLVKPGGLVVFSTLNRTPKSFALGIIAAEYLLRWVPRGTHHWKQFIKPSELTKYARNSGLIVNNINGLIYNPLKGDFAISRTDIDVNYFLTAEKAGIKA